MFEAFREKNTVWSVSKFTAFTYCTRKINTIFYIDITWISLKKTNYQSGFFTPSPFIATPVSELINLLVVFPTPPLISTSPSFLRESRVRSTCESHYQFSMILHFQNPKKIMRIFSSIWHNWEKRLFWAKKEPQFPN